MICIYECITTVSRISLDLTPVLTLSLWLYRLGYPSMLCISHSCAHSHSHSHSLSLPLSVSMALRGEGGHFIMVTNFLTSMLLGCHWQNFCKCSSSSGKHSIRSCTCGHRSI